MIGIFSRTAVSSSSPDIAKPPSPISATTGRVGGGEPGADGGRQAEAHRLEVAREDEPPAREHVEMATEQCLVKARVGDDDAIARQGRTQGREEGRGGGGTCPVDPGSGSSIPARSLFFHAVTSAGDQAEPPCRQTRARPASTEARKASAVARIAESSPGRSA